VNDDRVRVATKRKDTNMTDPTDQRHEEHLTAEEDDGSAEFQPEDGGTASPPLGDPGPIERG
jgi:hypothetical protein